MSRGASERCPDWYKWALYSVYVYSPSPHKQSLTYQDLVEIEDWNEYGELKQHVKIVAVAKSTGGPSTPLSKLSENVKPTATAIISKATEPKNLPVSGIAGPGATATPFTLAMRTVGEEAAAKAKVRKPLATLVGKSKPIAKALSPASAKKPEGMLSTTLTMMQCPNTSKWNRPSVVALPNASPQKHSIAMLESLQSPGSTAWKPVCMGFNALTLREDFFTD